MQRCSPWLFARNCCIQTYTSMHTWQSCAVAKSQKFWRPLDNQTWHWTGWLQQKLPKFGFRSLSYNCTVGSGAVFHSVCQVLNCPVTHQNLSLNDSAWLLNWPCGKAEQKKASCDLWSQILVLSVTILWARSYFQWSLPHISNNRTQLENYKKYVFVSPNKLKAEKNE